jgi:hypothetical protein
VSGTAEWHSLIPKRSTDKPAFAVADALLEDAGRLIAERRLAQAVMDLARALEVALAGCTAAVLLGPAEDHRATAVEMEMLRKRYRSTIGSMSLASLRNVVMTLVTRQVRPRTIAESLEFVEQSKRLGAIVPAREHFASIADAGVRSTVEALRDASIIDLCNLVIHQLHQPTEAEAEEQRRSVATLVKALPSVFTRDAAFSSEAVQKSQLGDSGH